jgi:hypothetical protein
VGARRDDEMSTEFVGARKAMQCERRCGSGLLPAGTIDLKLLHVLGEIAARHAFVDMLVTGEITKLLDARLHIVPGDTLAGVDGGEIDLIFDSFVASSIASAGMSRPRSRCAFMTAIQS